MSLTPTDTATDPTPANSPTMHHRLVCQDKHFCLGEPAFLPKNSNKLPNLKKCQNLKTKSFLSFSILAIRSSTGSLQYPQFWDDSVKIHNAICWCKSITYIYIFSDLYGQEDIVTYRLNWPKGWLSENLPYIQNS